MFTLSKGLYAVLFLLATRGEAAGPLYPRKNSTSTASATSTSSAATTSATVALNATVLDCFITLPNDPLSATGLATPYLLQPPCSMAVGTQQAFAEAAIYDPATGGISIYHPLVSNAGTPPAAAPVVPTLPAGAVVGLWFGFNGGVLQLLDVNGQDANNSPVLKGVDCVNGLPGVQGDVFGQVSWCNAQAWFEAANTGIAKGLTIIPDLGVDKNGNACPTSRSFEITDACPSDNVPTQYILDGLATAQDTAANEAAIKNGTVINNASDEALLTNILDPLIGCIPFLAPSLDNPGAMVPALALSELQASAKQLSPIGLVPLNDPDTLLTASGSVSTDKTNAYRLGVNQPPVAPGADAGDLITYCQNMVNVAPAFLKGFESTFIGQTTPDACVGSNLFTFLAERYLMSLTQLTCPPSAIPFQPVVCQLDGNGAATSCTITLANTTTKNNTTATMVTGVTKATSVSSLNLGTGVGTKLVATTSAVFNNATTSLATSVVATSVLATSLVASSSSVSISSSISTSSSVVFASTSSSSISIATSSSSVSTTAALSTAITTTTIVVEVISFFIFVLSLGGIAPGITGSEGAFLVLEETFVDLPSAASFACTHQFNSCAAFAGGSFQGTDCLAQHNACQGSASSASVTASTPGTVTQTATVPASAAVGGGGAVTSALGGASVVSTASVGTVTGAAVVNTEGPLPSSVLAAGGPGACPVLSPVTVTVVPTVSASAGVIARHALKHAVGLKARHF
jgi:hypothetical protein